MTKKIVLAVVVMLTAAGAAGADTMYIDGVFCDVLIKPLEKYSGAEGYADLKKNPNKNYQFDIKLTKDQQAAVNELLDRYETERGDTFLIVITAGITTGDNSAIAVICEFTSDTQYNKWTFRMSGR